jgi:mRNA interferase MazF
MNCKHGEIWLANLNPGKGTEPGKVRPVVILQTDDLNDDHPSVIICLITSQVIPNVTILRVRLHTGLTGLEVQSDILVDQIRAIDRTRLLQKLGYVNESILNDVKQNLQVLLEI